MKRREILGAIAAIALRPRPSFAQTSTSPSLKELRVGYQKNGILVIARQQGVLERALAARAIEVRWTEFTSGPPMLEAMNAGSVDIGAVGDTPPIFAQAGGAAVVYVAGQPITNGQGILVPRESAIRTLADLKGKRIGFTQGSSAHNVTLVALEKASLSYQDIVPIYLNPSDAAAAFVRGNIDAWAVWDPYFAIGEKHGGRILVEAGQIVKANSFYVGNREFAARHGDVLREVIDALAETARWAEANRDKVARSLADVTGVDLEIQTIAANRSSFAIGKVTEDILSTQQAVADRFYRLSLIPRPIRVRDAVWPGAQS